VAQNRVDWSDPRISPTVYEDMVAVLISRLYPQAQRVDGSGGDGGRDVLLPLPSGPEIFELKGFTGRMTNSRRSQVRRSLNRASANSPTAWHLVVPIDPTPGEITWFTELTEGYSFPCEWDGKNWLDGHMANHPELARYYIEGSSDEIVAALRELNQEQAYLAGGLPDAVRRISALTTRLNELDPHYMFAYSASPVDGIRVTVLPRYPGADRDSPIQINASFQFPDTEEGIAAATALEDAVSYGTPGTVSGDFVTQVTVDGIDGFNSAFTGGMLAFGPAETPLTNELQIALRAMDSNGTVVAQLPLKIAHRVAGTQGGELALTDIAGVLTVSIRFTVATRRFTLHYRYAPPDNMLPGILLPALRFLAEVHSGRSVVVLINGQDAGPPIVDTQTLPAEFDGYTRLVTDLSDIQHRSSVYFCMPSSLSADELADIAIAAQLFAGEIVRAEWSSSRMTLQAQYLDGLAELARGEVRDLWARVPYVLTIGGQDYPLGHVLRTCATAQVENWPDLPADTPPETEVEITLVPGSDSTLTMRLVESASPDVTDADSTPAATDS
jgi:hypothetical protein